MLQHTTISALAIILGSLVAAMATVATAWFTQRTIHRRTLVRDEMRKRESLYGEFISVCSRLIVDSLTNSLETPETLLPAYALVNRIRLSASEPVLQEADLMLRRISHQYSARNLSFKELHRLTQSQEGDPLKPFGEACRRELRAIRARA